MTTFKDEIKSVIEKLKTERDEVRVQLNLARMDLKDELSADWQKAEEHWENLVTKKVEIENSMDDGAEKLKEEWHEFVTHFKDVTNKLTERLKKG